MKVSELIQALEDIDAPDAEVRLAFQPSWPMQYDVGEVVVDEGHVHDFESFTDDGVTGWECSDPDCGEQVEGLERPLPTHDDLAPNVVYIAEAGQVYDAPYLPGSASKALGWR